MTSGPLWTSVRVTPSHDNLASRNACLAALFEAGAQGVHEDGAALVTHFPPSTNLDEVRDVLHRAASNATFETSPLPDVDWSEQWKTRIGAHDLGPLTIAPPWLASNLDASRTIAIEPGMAFGTGEHATTRGVVRLLPTVLHADDVVADLGAGSAVLAIAAALLGARQVFAIELDADAIPDAEANVVRNGVADRVHVIEGDAAALLPLIAPVNVVLANIISSVLIELLPVIAASLAVNGCAILSGILHEEREMMCRILDTHGWKILQEDAEDIWWSVSIARA